jgi:hypothetical protein
MFCRNLIITWRFIPFQFCSSNFNLKRTRIGHLYNREIPRALCNMNAHFRAHMSLPSAFIPIQLNSIHISTPHCCKIHWNIIAPFTHRPPKLTSPERFLPTTFITYFRVSRLTLAWATGYLYSSYRNFCSVFKGEHLNSEFK